MWCRDVMSHPFRGCVCCRTGQTSHKLQLTSKTESHRASTSGNLWFRMRSFPSRLKVRCAFSPITSTRSLGGAPGLDWPPTQQPKPSGSWLQQRCMLDCNPFARCLALRFLPVTSTRPLGGPELAPYTAVRKLLRQAVHPVGSLACLTSRSSRWFNAPPPVPTRNRSYV